jgi:hypothetical protein
MLQSAGDVGLSNGLSNREKEFLRVLYGHVENCATRIILGSELYDFAEKLGFNSKEVDSYSALYQDLGYVLAEQTFDGIAMVQLTSQGIRYVRHLDGLSDLTEREQQFLMILYDHAAGDVANFISRNELYPLAERMGFSEHEVYCYSALLHDFGYIVANLVKGEEVYSLKLTPFGVIYVRKYVD